MTDKRHDPIDDLTAAEVAAIRDLESRLQHVAANQIATIRGIAARRLHRPAETLPQTPKGIVGTRWGRFLVEQETEPGCWLIREDTGPDGTGGGRTFLLCEDETTERTARLYPCDTHGLVTGKTQRKDDSVQALLSWLGSLPLEAATRVLERPRPVVSEEPPKGWKGELGGLWFFESEDDPRTVFEAGANPRAVFTATGDMTPDDIITAGHAFLALGRWLAQKEQAKP